MVDLKLGRREFLGVAALVSAQVLAASWARSASLAPARSLFAGTRLAKNELAARFGPMPAGIKVPNVLLQSSDGTGRISDFHNGATLISLWADWCAPCLSEVHDLNVLGDRFRRSGFSIVALLQGSRLDLNGARAKLDASRAPGLPSWIEVNGATVAEALATPPGAAGFSLPCNLLVDRRGVVRGRSFGSNVLSTVDMQGGKITEKGKQQMLHVKTGWSLPAADDFARALSQGILDEIVT